MTGAGPGLVVVGDVVDDIIVRPTAPTAHGTDTAADIDIRPGGSGANQAVWSAAAGARVTFVGRVGASDVARHRERLEAAGVHAHLAGDPARPTGRIVVLVGPDGQRTMFTDRGANLGLTAADLPADLLAGADALHVSGYALFEARVRRVILPLMRRGRELGLPVSVDPGSAAFLRTVGPDAFLRWVGGTSVLLPNLDEGRLLTGHGEPADVVTALLVHVPVVALTLGSDGAIVAGRDEGQAAVPGRRADVVDTTGAGDAFCGSFLTAWLGGAGLRTAGVAGVAAGAEAVRAPGGRPAGSRAGDEGALGRSGSRPPG